MSPLPPPLPHCCAVGCTALPLNRPGLARRAAGLPGWHGSKPTLLAVVWAMVLHCAMGPTLPGVGGAALAPRLPPVGGTPAAHRSLPVHCTHLSSSIVANSPPPADDPVVSSNALPPTHLPVTRPKYKQQA
eukprot:GGOE01045043.1.p4 GENE.GGOE01045043.1~~GGOE01045043.1.p4  ORF type:complete len:131 (-),score=3.67 GGOE01045043.1:14-406(-)